MKSNFRNHGQRDAYGNNTRFKGYSDSQNNNNGNGHRFNNFNHNQPADSGFKSYANHDTADRQNIKLTEKEYNHVRNLRHNNTSCAGAGNNNDCKPSASSCSGSLGDMVLLRGAIQRFVECSFFPLT
uniref:Uncharacterized protein n=1 Tax=Solanum tuberosum TaxID=4113 RepID=M1DRP5_SOLTU